MFSSFSLSHLDLKSTNKLLTTAGGAGAKARRSRDPPRDGLDVLVDALQLLDDGRHRLCGV